MKKTSLKVLLLAVIFSALLTLGLTACGKDRTPKAELAAPENLEVYLNLTEDGETEFTLKWDKVKNASNYKVQVGGETYSTAKTKLDITEYVNAGRKTEIDVWAEDKEEYYKPSDSVTTTFDTPIATKNLRFTPIDGGYEVYTNNVPTAGTLVLPDTYLNKPILKIAEKGFRVDMGASSFQSVRLPSFLKVIGVDAFAHTELKEVIIPDSVTEIGDAAFENCKKLTKVNLGRVEKIGSNAFVETALTEVYIPKTVTILGTLVGAFGSLETLKSVTFEEGSNLKECGEWEFYETSLTEFPKNLPIIGRGMFGNFYLPDRPFLKGDLIIPDSVRIIDMFAFEHCYEVTSIHIPSTVTEIKGGAFKVYDDVPGFNVTIDEDNPYYKIENGVIYTKDGKQIVDYLSWNKNESFTVPSGVEHICDYAFYGAINLKEISLPYGVKTIGEAAFQDCSLAEISLPDSVTSVESYAFRGPFLRKITLSNGLTKICDATFYDSRSLTHIDLPDSITTIGGLPFGLCYQLESVVLPKGLTEVCPNDIRLFVGFFAPLKILPTIYFKGTLAEWNELMQKGILRKELFMDYGRQMPIYFYSEEEPPKMAGGAYDNKYWHYDENGMPVIWEIEK